MFVDSHCHLDFPELSIQLNDILDKMQLNQVEHALCVSVSLPNWPRLIDLIKDVPQLSASVGVHPDYEDTPDPSVEELIELAQTPKVIAIGETGLDYFRCEGDMTWQQERFRRHIRAAIAVNKPLIIHTRAAAEDTLRIMREENAAQVGGVLHCFTESWEVAQAAMEMNFYISFSGIVTFKNAVDLQNVASKIPLDRFLIETDAPYLAPVPYRGKLNDPSLVVHVAEKIADLKSISVAEVGRRSTENFYRLFHEAPKTGRWEFVYE